MRRLPLLRPGRGAGRGLAEPGVGFGTGTASSRFTGAAPPKGYAPNPPPQCNASSCRQSLLASAEGRGWVTAWRQDGAARLVVALTTDLPRPAVADKTIRAAAEAHRALDAAFALGAEALAAEHASWWSRYYWSDGSGAFLSLPASAAQLEQFHWIQVFKIGAENACRRFKDSAWDDPSFLDNCVLLDGINGESDRSGFRSLSWKP